MRKIRFGLWPEKKRDRILLVLLMGAGIGIWAGWTILHKPTLLGGLCSFVCLLCFLGAGAALLPGITRTLWEGDAPGEAPGKPTGRERLWVLLFMIVTRIALYLIAWAMLTAWQGDSGSLFDCLERTWRMGYGVDGPSYLGIAQNGYVTQGDAMYHLVFLPMYPLIIKIFSFVTGEYLYAGFLASNVCALLAAQAALTLFRMDMGVGAARRGVVLLFLSPAAFFFLIPMTESLFLLLLLWGMILLRKNRWWSAGLVGFCLALTRLQGVLFVVAMGLEMSGRRPDLRRFQNLRWLALLLPLLGVGAYLLINYQVSGDPLQFLTYQREHWSQEAVPFFAPAAYMADYARGALLGGDHSSLFALYLPCLVTLFLCPLLTAWAGRDLRPSWGGWLLCYYAMSMGAGWLLSAPRYMSVAFPLPAMVAGKCEKHPALWGGALAVSLGGLLLYLWFFVSGGPVY